MVTPHCHEGMCAVPPHPDLLQRFKTKLAKAKGTGDEAKIKKLTQSLVLETRSGVILGQNDGTIFPPSHFDSSVSISAMSRAALERTPIRGTIK